MFLQLETGAYALAGHLKGYFVFLFQFYYCVVIQDEVVKRSTKNNKS